MHFDDRLATVLRIRATGERAARTQFRQLIDLLGERPQAGDKALKAAAYLRLIALGEMIPVAERARMVGESGWRFRNPELVKWFGEAHPNVASAALYRAQLTGEEWQALIPQLPIRARGFLRQRRDLPDDAVSVLDQLGVSDRGLPQPEPLELIEEMEPPFADEAAEDVALPEDDPAPAPATTGVEGIRALVDRIEAFQRSRGDRQQDGDAPQLQIAVDVPPEDSRPLDQFSFGSDSDGKVDWADPEVAPMLVGLDLGSLGNATLAELLALRQPVRASEVALRGASRIEGDWIVDAAPRFTRSEGRFFGYVGCFRRAVSMADDIRHAEADRLRQLLHELRTPVNAMQGYAEIIQQQMIGPVPHEYRAIAATIAGDAAHILAGFDELDRLARLETGALDLDPGESDFAAIARHQVAQLQTVLSPRVARFDAELADTRAPLALDAAEAERLAWRLLATLAGAVSAGEAVALMLTNSGDHVELSAQLPAALRDAKDVFSVEARGTSGALSAGIFGAGFSLRLARAEARAAGGELARVEDRLILSLPLLTAQDLVPSPEIQPDRAPG